MLPVILVVDRIFRSIGYLSYLEIIYNNNCFSF